MTYKYVSVTGKTKYKIQKILSKKHAFDANHKTNVNS